MTDISGSLICSRDGSIVLGLWNLYERDLQSPLVCQSCFIELRGYTPHPAHLLAGRMY